MRKTMMKKYESPRIKWMSVETAGIMAASKESGNVDGGLSKENKSSWIEDEDESRTSSVWDE